jgi:hypothetical protein
MLESVQQNLRYTNLKRKYVKHKYYLSLWAKKEMVWLDMKKPHPKSSSCIKVHLERTIHKIAAPQFLADVWKIAPTSNPLTNL